MARSPQTPDVPDHVAEARAEELAWRAEPHRELDKKKRPTPVASDPQRAGKAPKEGKTR